MLNGIDYFSFCQRNNQPENHQLFLIIYNDTLSFSFRTIDDLRLFQKYLFPCAFSASAESAKCHTRIQTYQFGFFIHLLGYIIGRIKG
jgi:hypothetical protein